MRSRSLLLCLVALTAACGDRASRGAAGADGGTMVISTGGEADGFLPPLTVNVTSGQVESQLFDKLAEPGMQLNLVGDAGFEPRLAANWTWAADSLSIAFHVHPMARWHDGKPVTAKDVLFTYQIYTDSVVGSLVKPLLVSIDSVTVRDSLTVVFWYSKRSPGQFYDAASQMRILPEHILGSVPRAEIKNAPFRRNPVGSGPFKFVRWDDRQAIVVEANTAYHLGRPHLDRVIWSIAPDPSATVLRLFAGEADFLETLRPADTVELAKHPEIVAMQYPSLAIGFVVFNVRDPKNPKAPHPIFGNREVRRALSMAIEREKVVNSVFNGRASVGNGPITHGFSTYDSTVALLPYSLDSAKRILDAREERTAARLPHHGAEFEHAPPANGGVDAGDVQTGRREGGRADGGLRGDDEPNECASVRRVDREHGNRSRAERRTTIVGHGIGGKGRLELWHVREQDLRCLHRYRGGADGPGQGARVLPEGVRDDHPGRAGDLAL
jgi:peptide/nickel transport system substrate-binding protein